MYGLRRTLSWSRLIIIIIIKIISYVSRSNGLTDSLVATAGLLFVF
jgi:hypothetical protein